MKSTHILPFLLFSLFSTTLCASELSMHLCGDSIAGYTVCLYDGSIPVSTPQFSGELNGSVENEDHSIKETISNWKATAAVQHGDTITLTGIVRLLKLETDLAISVTYRQINKQVVEKDITWRQTNIPLLFYSINTALNTSETASRCWSFDDADQRGGVIHETFPAAGYMIGDTLCVGLLTDAGNKNLWTRNIRRRPSTGETGFRAIREICDANLFRILPSDQQAPNKDLVQLTLGELSDFNHPVKLISYKTPALKQWTSYNGAKLTTSQGVYLIQEKNANTDLAGFRIPYHLPDGFYTVRFKHRSTNPISLRLFKNDGTSNQDVQGFHYQTNIPSSTNGWTSLEETVFLANTENGLTRLLIAASNLKKGQSYKLAIKDLEVIQSVGETRAYHPLKAGVPQLKRIFIFATPARPTLHDFRLASQVCLSDGLHFHGTVEEKCLYACYQMLMWITSSDNFTPLSVPSINYAPDMYNRDSFWSLAGVNDKESSEQVFNAWAATQNDAGAIGTIITPCMGSKELKGNDATPEFLWFALINHRNYGTPLPVEKLKKAFDYCIREFDPDNDGICKATFVLGQNDCADYPDGTSDLSVNQGMFAVTLRVAQALGLPVRSDYIEKANAGYRAFYDSKKGYFLDNRSFDYVISFNSLLPEFVSWWLFNQPILSSDMVINTLNKIPSKNGYAPLIAHEGADCATDRPYRYS